MEIVHVFEYSRARGWLERYQRLLRNATPNSCQWVSTQVPKAARYLTQYVKSGYPQQGGTYGVGDPSSALPR